MEDYYRHVYKDVNKVCAGCKHCDFKAFLVNDADKIYHGYDGSSMCLSHNLNKPESNKNRFAISAHWPICDMFEQADEYDYIKELCIHIVYALTEFPNNTEGKTKQEVFDNVIGLYKDTMELYPPKKEITYDEDFFNELELLYNMEIGPGEYQEKIEKPIVEKFINNFY